MSELSDLFSRLDEALPSDRGELRARLGGLGRRQRAGASPDPRALAAVREAIERSVSERERRKALVPRVSYPPELPFTAAIDAVRSALASSQVVVVAGETGSGKSTQLPKLCLELGRGVDGQIAHTQPRRIAARGVARRVAEELGVKLGAQVGVKVRFGDETSRDTLVRVLTDGMLLAETRSDPKLDRYDTIIVDEAHERSLNIDFLLGYLRRLLPKRPDLKLILTSATIDVERLAAHFGGAPVVEIPGRAHPIETRHRAPPADGLDEEDPRMLEAVAGAIEEIDASFAERRPGGVVSPDILVFLSGEREIREVEAFLSGRLPGVGAKSTEIVPLFARQALEEQERVFSPGRARRIVLSTNVAETSLTVPRIHAVVDLGLARLLRYSPRARVQRLPVEPISQASARQRAGRAGRLGPGIAVRLYSEDDFAARSEYTQPEIQRTNLAAVILQMEALNLGKAEDFPFVDPPSGRALADGRSTLVELGASTEEGRLTRIGRSMSLLPLDPRLSRVLLASIDERCTNDALVVCAALAVQDPRVRPEKLRDAADLAHVRFRDPASDFLGFLRLWRIWRSETKELGSSARRRWCEKNFVSHQRMREWSDVVQQLRELFDEHFGIRIGEPSEETDHGAFHRAVLAGFASHVGVRNEKGEYRGPTGALFAIHPSSALARRGPNWVVAAEIVETSRRYARICARIQPEWIARVAPHLCSRSTFEPHFVEESGQVAAWERTTFGELVMVPRRRVPFGPVDPVGARHVFLNEALVLGRARTAGEFLARNRALRESLEREEARGRRRGLLLEDEAAFAFYDARVPAEIHSVPSFERWRRAVEARDPRALEMRVDDLLRDGAERPDARDYPESLAVDALALPLDYAHDPSHASDGITARVPVEALSLLDPRPFEWLVPGLLAEKVEALVRSLPKHLRVRLFPIEEVVQGAVESLEYGRGSLKAALARHLSGLAQAEIRPQDFRDDLLPTHLAMRYSVVDADGRELGSGRDLAELSRRFAAVARDSLRASIDRATDPVARLEREGIEDAAAAFPDRPLPETLAYTRAGIALEGHPALVESGGRVALRVLDSRRGADEAHAAAASLFVAREVREAVEHHVGYDAKCEELCALAERRFEPDLVGTVARLVAAEAIAQAPRPPRSMGEFLAVVRAASGDLHERVAVTVRLLHAVLAAEVEILGRTRGATPDPRGDSRGRILARLGELLGARGLEGIAALSRDELAQRLRLLQMLLVRLERLREVGSERDLAADAAHEALRRRVEEACSEPRRTGAGCLALRRMLEEIEISVFAPRLPRAFPASERRLEQLLEPDPRTLSNAAERTR